MQITMSNTALAIVGHAEVERDNPVAGVSFGTTLIAVGFILSKTVSHRVSLPDFFAWFLTSVALIFINRFLVDKLLLPYHKLDGEIATDQNWGVAFVEGGSAVMVFHVDFYLFDISHQTYSGNGGRLERCP